MNDIYLCAHYIKHFLFTLEKNSKNYTQMEILEQRGCFLAADIRTETICSGTGAADGIGQLSR